MGFRTDDRSLRRAVLDYWDAVELQLHSTFAEFENAIGNEHIWCIETPAARRFTEIKFRPGDCIVFGSESKGLPAEVRDRYAARTFGIPMPTGKVRSLNLATATGIVLYEALRQLHGW
jgi:tRNA (cytidine/uridine-2'-O-)-methyltransferase